LIAAEPVVHAEVKPGVDRSARQGGDPSKNRHNPLKIVIA
jgi:hypothetical protein